MGVYGQFCPVAKATEVLDERWTLLVVRELIAGSQRFNDIHRGVPRMSRSLLSRRLRTLARHRLVDRRDDGDGPRYVLTAAGRELEPVVEAVGSWGLRWMSELRDQDLDPALLIWDMHRRIDLDAVPPGRTVLQVSFADLAGEFRDWWLLLSPQSADVCADHPGCSIDVVVETPLRTMVEIWRGDTGWNDALRSGQLAVIGPSHLRRKVPDWLLLSHFATVAGA